MAALIVERPSQVRSIKDDEIVFVYKASKDQVRL